MKYMHSCRYNPKTVCKPINRGGKSQLIASFQNRIDRDKVVKYNPWRPGKNKVKKRLGYTLDLNGDGRYSRGSDGVLTFDMNGDGKYNRRDVITTNKMMQAAAGRFDFNNDGRVSRAERSEGSSLQTRYTGIDTNRDGRLSTHEMARDGGKVWVDKSGGGGVQERELHSIFQVPSSLRSGRPTRLDSVDPLAGTSRLRMDSCAPKSYHCHTCPRPSYNAEPFSFIFAFLFGK